MAGASGEVGGCTNRSLSMQSQSDLIWHQHEVLIVAPLIVAVMRAVKKNAEWSEG